MSEKLPAPRDEGERRCMTLAWEAGAKRVFEMQRGDRALWAGTKVEADLAIPPVSRPEMPTLRHCWGVIDCDGDLRRGPYRDRTVAEAECEKLRNISSWSPYRVVRLAVEEVIEPEPEAAPSGWRYEVERTDHGCTLYRLQDGDRVRLLDVVGDEGQVTVDHLANMVPPIDREYVAALLERGK